MKITVKTIEAKRNAKRVAAYARVSTLAEQQEESYETQVEYYTKLINNTKGWVLAGIYADQGLSGTTAKKRPQFMQMISDAHEGKIDIVLCKSISRFSRNAGEAQLYVQELKKCNVEVRFEKEGISTFDSKSDFLFSIFAALAQEESRSISENLKWTFRRLAEQGIRHVGSNHMLGYDEIDGKLTPNKDAWIVKLMYEEYAAGIAPRDILRHLKEKGAKRMRSDKEFEWAVALSILKNEAYAGNRLLQKRPPTNYLTKRPDPTESYESRFITEDHEGIVSYEIWNAVQERLKKNKAMRRDGIHVCGTSHFLYGKVFCAYCGSPFRRTYDKQASGLCKVWKCRGRIQGNGCRNPTIREDTLLAEIKWKMGWNAKDDFDLARKIGKVFVKDGSISLVEDPPCSEDENKPVAEDGSCDDDN